MLGPVHWGAFPGEYLEKVMAVLVAQDHPDTLRREPASGDGGIDLMVPDGDGIEVRQVKRFARRIDDKARRQIEKSWRTLRRDPRLARPITAYRLVVPVDPTPDEQAWFDSLVSDAPWPTAWLGETHWHDLASRHPHVIDYFFGGGQDRVAQRARALQSAVLDPSRPPTAMDVAASLAAMKEALNRDDPHYRYEIRTSAEPPAGTKPFASDCVFAETTALGDGGFVTVTVHPKHRYALHDAPIRGTLTVNISDPDLSTQLRAALSAFEDFGRALDLPEGTVSVNLEAPGGLGGSFEGAAAWIGPAPSESYRPPLRLVVVDQHGRAQQELVLDVIEATTGPAGGAELHLTDSAGGLVGQLLLHPPRNDERQLTFNFSLADLAGRPVVEVLPAVKLLGALTPAHKLQLRPRYGNQVLAEAEIDLTDSAIIDPHLVTLLEDLAVVQDYAPGPVRVPEVVEASFANELRQYATMLLGEVITGTWDSITANLRVPRSELPALPEMGSLVIVQPVTLDLDDQQIDLGPFTTVLHSAKLAEEQPEERQARFVPAANAEFIWRAGDVVHPPGHGQHA